MRSSFMIGCLVVLALFLSQFVPSTKAQQVAARTPKVLEYKVFLLDNVLSTVASSWEVEKHKIRNLLEEALNKKAAEGWEFSGGFEEYLIFERQK